MGDGEWMDAVANNGDETIVFDNWRVLHGRSAFTGVRRICGGYSKCFPFLPLLFLFLFDSKGLRTRYGLARFFCVICVTDKGYYNQQQSTATTSSRDGGTPTILGARFFRGLLVKSREG